MSRTHVQREKNGTDGQETVLMPHTLEKEYPAEMGNQERKNRRRKGGGKCCVRVPFSAKPHQRRDLLPAR